VQCRGGSGWARWVPIGVAAALLLSTGSAGAQEELPDEAGRPLWEVGAFGLGGEQLAYPGSDTRLQRALALPYGIYRGKRVRVGEGSVGVRAVKTATTELDIGFSGSFGSSASEVPIRAGMPNLGNLVEFGPRLKFNLPRWVPGTRITASLPLRGVFDLNDSLRDRGVAFEPVLSLGWRPWASTGLGASLSAIYGDRRLANHFYGVPEAFADAGLGRGTFEAEAGLIATRLNLSATLAPHRDWRIFSYVRVESVNGAANEASPLVRQSTGYTVGVALSWTILRSEQPGED
jgi:outer membrane protein